MTDIAMTAYYRGYLLGFSTRTSGELSDDDRSTLRKAAAHLEELEHELDVQCSSKHVEMLYKRIEQLEFRLECEATLARNTITGLRNKVDGAIDALRNHGLTNTAQFKDLKAALKGDT